MRSWGSRERRRRAFLAETAWVSYDRNVAVSDQQGDRPRCPIHNIAKGNDGRCLLCQRNRPEVPEEPRSAWPWVVTVALLGFGALGAYALWGRDSGDASPVVATTPEPAPLPDEGETRPASGQPVAPAPNFRSIEQKRDGVRADRDAREAQIAQEMKSVPITMYAPPSCGLCNYARLWFQEKGYSITEKPPPADDAAGATEPAGNAGAASQPKPEQKPVPTFDVDGISVRGFSEARMERVIRQAAVKRLQK